MVEAQRSLVTGHANFQLLDLLSNDGPELKRMYSISCFLNHFSLNNFLQLAFLSSFIPEDFWFLELTLRNQPTMTMNKTILISNVYNKAEATITMQRDQFPLPGSDNDSMTKHLH